MNAEQPRTVDLREHYRQLIRTRALDVAMCWTVVVPDNGTALSLDQITARLSGDASHRLHAAASLGDLWHFLNGGDYPVLIDWYDSATVIFEYDYLGASPAVLRRLSREARVYSAWWNVNAVNRLSFAADGELVLTIDALFPGSPEHYPGISRWPELEAMEDFFVEFEERGDDYDWRAAWLALVDQTTGAKLTSQWLDQEHPCVTVNTADATR
ncbi:DUF6461 domain-containing protein [Thermoactinospora rubra]|uniref:DUF6461 domain-containing protein n=1 Tax=Thermoactinospora rubra TaxID=1088767 RepID=UPI000A11717E|nr:DUF6461 domain-containing protein [Thermoactinospora rubra]